MGRNTGPKGAALAWPGSMYYPMPPPARCPGSCAGALQVAARAGPVSKRRAPNRQPARGASESSLQRRLGCAHCDSRLPARHQQSLPSVDHGPQPRVTVTQSPGPGLAPAGRPGQHRVRLGTDAAPETVTVTVTASDSIRNPSRGQAPSRLSGPGRRPAGRPEEREIYYNGEYARDCCLDRAWQLS